MGARPSLHLDHLPVLICRYVSVITGAPPAHQPETEAQWLDLKDQQRAVRPASGNES